MLLLVVSTGVKNYIPKMLFIIYVSYWCGSLYLSTFDDFGLFNVDDQSYYLLLGHLFAFICGYLVVPSRNAYRSKHFEINVQKIIMNIPFMVLFSLCFIFVVILFIRQREMLAIYSLANIRGDFTELILGKGLFTFFSTLPTGMFHFSICLSLYMLFFYRKWIYIIIFLTYSVLFAILGGGRHQFAIFIYYLIGFLILKNYIVSSVKQKSTKYIIPTRIKIVMALMLLFLVVGMSLFTSYRRNSDAGFNEESVSSGVSGLGETIVNYSVGPIVAFDRGLKMKRYQNNNYYGTATFAGTEYVLHRFFLRYIFPNYELTYEKVTSYLQNNRILIGINKTWNYAYTSCFYYYCDLGIMGILIIPFILGIIFRFFIKMIEENLTIYSIAIFLFISFCFYDSVFSCYLHKNISVLYILFLTVLHFYQSNHRSIILQRG